MASDNRPLSPHLQIYRWSLTMLLSILHRATGVALTVGTLVLIYWLCALAVGPEAYATAQGLLSSGLGQLLLFGWSVALFYHLSNGVRHLAWDLGFGFEKEQARQSGVAVLIATGILTFLAWTLGLTIGA
ncbi:MAG: succinate dehydrogenase, cytochrome b556 subunit [Pseudomonadota bacterium]|nr:succinate dehydrogenase, cytochrome b556 subunit [Pseudomonadota bacterium]